MHAPPGGTELAAKRNLRGLDFFMVVRVIDDSSRLWEKQVRATFGVGSSNCMKALMVICGN